MYEMKKLVGKRENLKLELHNCNKNIEESKDKNLAEVLKIAVDAIFGTIPKMTIEDNVLKWSEHFIGESVNSHIDYIDVQLENIQEIRLTKDHVYLSLIKSDIKTEIDFREDRVQFFDELEYRNRMKKKEEKIN